MINNWAWPEVDQLESQEKYREALALMSSAWKKEPENLKTLVRLGFLCWYLTVESEVLTETKIDSKEIKAWEKLLSELTTFGLNTFSDHPDFLWIFGYMISLFPENFYIPAKEEMKELGEGMLKKAHQLRPEDKIIEMVYKSEQPDQFDSILNSQFRIAVSNSLAERFMGEGEMQRYFREVLDR